MKTFPHAFSTSILQSDSLGWSPEIIIINRVMICRWKRKFTSTYFGRCGGNWVTEGEDAGQRDAPCLYTLFRRTARGIIDWMEWREPGRQAPGQWCKVHSAPRFHFHREITMRFAINIGMKRPVGAGQWSVSCHGCYTPGKGASSSHVSIGCA